MEITSKAATVAENKPVYCFELNAQRKVSIVRTHEEHDLLCIFLPAFGDAVVFVLCHL